MQHRELICKLVTSSGLSINEVASKIGSSPKSIYKWMNGSSLPNCKHLLALLDIAYECEKSTFLQMMGTQFPRH